MPRQDGLPQVWVPFWWGWQECSAVHGSTSSNILGLGYSELSIWRNVEKKKNWKVLWIKTYMNKIQVQTKKDTDEGVLFSFVKTISKTLVKKKPFRLGERMLFCFSLRETAFRIQAKQRNEGISTETSFSSYIIGYIWNFIFLGSMSNKVLQDVW